MDMRTVPRAAQTGSSVTKNRPIHVTPRGNLSAVGRTIQFTGTQYEELYRNLDVLIQQQQPRIAACERPSPVVSPNTTYFGKFDDGLFYRCQRVNTPLTDEYCDEFELARKQTANQQSVKVKFIDYGDVRDIPPSDLRMPVLTDVELYDILQQPCDVRQYVVCDFISPTSMCSQDLLARLSLALSQEDLQMIQMTMDVPQSQLGWVSATYKNGTLLGDMLAREGIAEVFKFRNLKDLSFEDLKRSAQPALISNVSQDGTFTMSLVNQERDVNNALIEYFQKERGLQQSSSMVGLFGPGAVQTGFTGVLRTGSESRKFMRVQITDKVDPVSGEVSIRAVDCGIHWKVPSKEIMILPSCFLDKPKCSIRCRMELSANVQFSEDMKFMLAQMVAGKQLHVQGLSVSPDGLFAIRLFDTTTNTEINSLFNRMAAAIPAQAPVPSIPFGVRFGQPTSQQAPAQPCIISSRFRAPQATDGRMVGGQPQSVRAQVPVVMQAPPQQPIPVAHQQPMQMTSQQPMQMTSQQQHVRRSLIYNSLSEGPHAGIISFVRSPRCFYFVEGRMVETLKVFQAELNRFYSQKIGPGAASSFSPADVVAAVYPADDSYYRAVVLAVEGRSATVLFVDYGNEERVDVYQMHQLDPNFLQTPVFAHQCQLEGVKHVPPSPHHRDCFAKLEQEAIDLNVLSVATQMQGHVHIVRASFSSPVYSQIYNTRDLSDVIGLLLAQFGATISPGQRSSASSQGLSGSFQPAKFRIGQIEECEVTHVNNADDFYIRRDAVKVGEQNVAKYLQQAYNSSVPQLLKDPQPIPQLLKDPQPMQPCVVLNDENNKFYRAEVLQTNEQEVTVLLVDSGKRLLVKRANVKSATSQAVSMSERLAIRCHLRGIKPIRRDYNVAEVRRLLQVNQSMLCVLFSPVGASYPADMYVHRQGTGVPMNHEQLDAALWINQQMVNSELALVDAPEHPAEQMPKNAQQDAEVKRSNQQRAEAVTTSNKDADLSRLGLGRPRPSNVPMESPPKQRHDDAHLKTPLEHPPPEPASVDISNAVAGLVISEHRVPSSLEIYPNSVESVRIIGYTPGSEFVMRLCSRENQYNTICDELQGPSIQALRPPTAAELSVLPILVAVHTGGTWIRGLVRQLQLGIATVEPLDDPMEQLIVHLRDLRVIPEADLRSPLFCVPQLALRCKLIFSGDQTVESLISKSEYWQCSFVLFNQTTQKWQVKLTGEAEKPEVSRANPPLCMEVAEEITGEQSMSGDKNPFIHPMQRVV